MKTKNIIKSIGVAAIVLATVVIGTGCTYVRETVSQTIVPASTNAITGTYTPPSTNTLVTRRSRLWDGYVIEHSSTIFGADAESPSTENSGTVKLKVGFGNDYTRLTPTVNTSNGIVAPDYVTSLGIHQSLSSSDISGESSSGHTFYSSTNGTAGASIPGTPTPQQIPHVVETNN